MLKRREIINRCVRSDTKPNDRLRGGLRNRVAALLLIAHFAPPCSAGWFGPSDYNECILENIGKAQTHFAAYAIRGACANKFHETAPCDLLSAETLAKLKLEDHCAPLSLYIPSAEELDGKKQHAESEPPEPPEPK